MIKRQANILLVLPPNFLRDIYQKRAEREGFDVELAQNLVDAERKAVSFRPNMLVVDASFIDDPKLFMERVRSLPSLVKSRIIVVASALSAGAVRALRASGISDIVLTMHHHPSDLFKYLKTHTL